MASGAQTNVDVQHMGMLDRVRQKGENISEMLEVYKHFQLSAF